MRLLIRILGQQMTRIGVAFTTRRFQEPVVHTNPEEPVHSKLISPATIYTRTDLTEFSRHFLSVPYQAQ